jgi:hypothetical protein
MKYKFAIIFTIAILSIATLLILRNNLINISYGEYKLENINSSSNISYSGYKLEKINIEIDNQNLTLYLLNVYGEGCYQYNITNGYFIIYDQFINNSFVFCNESIEFEKTILSCLPHSPNEPYNTELMIYSYGLLLNRAVNYTNNTCPNSNLYIANATYTTEITYPVIIVDNYFLPYDNESIYCYSNTSQYKISYAPLPANYLYNAILNILNIIHPQIYRYPQ